MKSKKGVFLVVFLFFSRIMFCGFSSETLVKVHDGYVPIERLEVGDSVVSSDLQGNCLEKKITHKRQCRQENCLCLVVGQEEIVTSKNQKFFLVDDHAWKLAKDLMVGDVLLDSNGDGVEVDEIVELEQANLLEITVDQYHIFFVSKNELLVHNFAATAVTGLGCIAVSNPVAAVIGATVALAVLTPKLYNTYIKKRAKAVCGQASVPSVLTEKDSVLVERYYFVQRKKDLEKLAQSYLCIINDIRFLWPVKGMLFTSHFFDYVSTRHPNDFSTINSIIGISIEKHLNDKQRQELRVARASELRQLERGVIELQWALATHFNELIEQRDKAFQAYDEASPNISSVIDLWNSTSEPTYNFVLQSYEKDLLERHLLENIHSRNNELQCVLRYYKTSSIAQSCFEKSSNLTERIESLIKRIAETECWVKQQKERVTKNLIIVERYCDQNSINLIHLLREVQNKLAKQKQKLIQKELELAKQKQSTPPNPNEPENNEDEEEPEFEIPENSASHMFKDEPGHFSHDTPSNRQRLIDLVSDKGNLKGEMIHGTKCYGTIVEEGKQLWAYVRGNLIRDGGLNEIPKEFNPKTGFSRLLPPKFTPKFK